MSRLSLNSSSSSSGGGAHTTTTTNNNNNTSNHNNTSSNNSIPNGHNQPASNQSNSIINQQQQQITGSPLDQPADCTIACEEGHLTAHKLVLCDHSKYLQDILSKFPTAEHPIIILTELNIVDIKILVNYMYTGELVITSDSSPTSLLRAAQILKIDSLTEEEEDEEEAAEDGEVELRRPPQIVQDHDMDESEAEIEEQQQHQQMRHQVWQNNRDLDDDERDLDDDDDDQDEDEDDEDMLQDHQLDEASASDCRLINSVYNIYSLNQFINPTTPPSPPSMQMQHHHHHNNNNNLNNNNHLQHHQINNIHNNNNNTSISSQESKHLDKNNKIRCHLCNIGLSDVKCLYRHVLTRHLPEKWGYKCEFCDREFSRDDHLMRHYTTKHKNMEFNREKIRETRRLNREMAKNFHDQISVDILAGTSNKL